MGYHHPRQTNPYPQGNVQGGQQGSGYNNQRSSRSHSLQPSVQTGNNPTLNRSLSANRSQVSGQAQAFDPYGTGQNREAGQPYVPSTNTPYIGTQGQLPSPSYQDPSQAYQSTDYFPLEGQPSHIVPQVPQQNRTHRSPSQQPSVPQNSSHSVQSQYPQYQRGDVEYQYAQHQQQQRSSPSQYPQQQQPSIQPFSQQSQSSPPQYHQQHQQPSTQPYSQHQQPSPPQQQRQYQVSSQQYTQQQHFATASGNAASSFGSNVPSGMYEMPGEDIRQSRSLHRGTSPVCRLLNCRNLAIRDGATQELTEYCSQDHMQDDVRRGVPLCPACHKCPRRLDGRYCGISCEKYDRERSQQPHHQQQHYPRPPSGVRPHLSTPSPSTWGTALGESSSVGNFAGGGGLVHCPKCRTTYSARRRNHGGGQISPVDYASPPCPTCGFCQ